MDDDANQAGALAALLQLDGVAAISEHVAAAALARAMIEPPDAIVLNVKMPGVSGTELLAALRARHPDLPVLLLTGYDMHDPRLAAALASGSVGYLAKPVELPRLVEMLGRLFEQRGIPKPVRPEGAS
ncbi:MAG TPA: response regulator [Kofleriaceae bacterium]